MGRLARDDELLLRRAPGASVVARGERTDVFAALVVENLERTVGQTHDVGFVLGERPDDDRRRRIFRRSDGNGCSDDDRQKDRTTKH